MVEHSLAVSMRDVNFRYRKSTEWAIRNINLDIRRGEFIVITGPNTAGKTTLSLCLTGIIPHDIPGKLEGTVEINGINTHEKTTSKLAKHIGMVFSEPESQFLGVTVEDDIIFGPENLSLEVNEITRRLNWVLEVCRLTSVKTKPPSMLSGGQKQRTAIASILAMLPNILILDEPTVELDPVGKTEVLEVVDELRRSRQMTIIWITAKIEEIAAHADRIILMDKGQILRDSTPNAFLEDVPFQINGTVNL
ncbi:MAG: energy-coupling factor ABC transporter ATP-binding protein [Candidatus Ranarchaeia archaeon]